MVYITEVKPGLFYEYKSVWDREKKQKRTVYIGPVRPTITQVEVGRFQRVVRKAVAHVLPTAWSMVGEDQLVDAVVGELKNLVREVALKTFTRRPEYASETESET